MGIYILPLTNVRLSYYPCTLSSPPYPCMNLFPIHDFACIINIRRVNLVFDAAYDIGVSNRVDSPIIVSFFF